MRKTHTILLAGLLLVAGAYAFKHRSHANDWVWIGRDSVKNIEDVPIRLMDVKDPDVSATERDVLNLTLGLQAGTLKRKLVLFPAHYCYAPRLRDGYPSVTCRTNGGDLIVVASDNVREVLLGLEKDHRYAAVIGRAVGTYADIGVIAVIDPAAKRE
ncbi:hypothetical protein OYT13_18795 [Pandoraea sp. XJJ-1]|uniref:hypothetical protein n=1 Tax=Pandoraea sp. XJJ-1 TaxID=3002643 RepID=UPI00227FD6D7|nr:hypothetical protein [Pandoraea sp. XJJ-1]WAL81853.1 hypothetical protein OYT13_18795 [Pandoraea sp. XJJ-1]